MRAKRTVYTIAAAFALATGLACRPDGATPSGGDANNAEPPPGRAFACDMRPFDRPGYHDKGEHGEIRGTVKITCNPKPISHHTHVTLERSFNGQGVWETSAIKDTAEVPDADGMKVTATYVGCITGVWRIAARADGVGPDGREFEFTLPVGERRETGIRCPGPK